MEKNTKFESFALIVLTIMLVSVFVLSVNMYEDIAANTEEGALSVFAGAVREYLDEGGAVAAFFGFEETAAATESVDTAALADAYIERYNEIYAGNK